MSHAIMRTLAGALAVAAAIACNSGPARPGPVGPVATSRLELVAPAEIAPGETVQLALTAVKSDGSVETVAARAQWTSSADVLQISPAGLATAANRGEALVTAQFDGRSANARILLLPRGTYRLTGQVRDRDTFTGIENAALTVASGIGSGLRATTGPDGTFSFYGLSGDVTIHVEKSDYNFTTVPLEVAAHRVQDIAIARGGHIGAYTLTIHTGSCEDAFPRAGKERVYTAQVSHVPSPFGVGLYFSLTGPDFIVTDGVGNGFPGSITPRDAILNIRRVTSCYYGEPCGYLVVERFDDGALAVDGQGWGTGTLDAASGPFTGEIRIFAERRAPFTTVKSRCKTASFELVRRRSTT